MTSIPTELRELLERIVAGDVGRMIYAKLATGQATETDDGKAWLELRALLATPPADAADMGGQAGEEVEVVGYLDAHDCLWNETTHPDRMIPLMTVGQHQRIVAVISAQPSAHVSVPRELLERTICRLTHGHEHDKAVRELRALLNGGEANG